MCSQCQCSVLPVLNNRSAVASLPSTKLTSNLLLMFLVARIVRKENAKPQIYCHYSIYSNSKTYVSGVITENCVYLCPAGICPPISLFPVSPVILSCVSQLRPGRRSSADCCAPGRAGRSTAARSSPHSPQTTQPHQYSYLIF